MTISLKKDRACNCVLKEVPSEVERGGLGVRKDLHDLSQITWPFEDSVSLFDEGWNQYFSSHRDVMMIK